MNSDLLDLIRGTYRNCDFRIFERDCLISTEKMRVHAVTREAQCLHMQFWRRPQTGDVLCVNSADLFEFATGFEQRFEWISGHWQSTNAIVR